MPAAPLVGAVTTRPPAAFSSLTASANRFTQSISASGSLTPAPGTLRRRYSAGARRLTLNGPGSSPSLRKPRSTQACIACQIARRPVSISGSLRQCRSLARITPAMSRPVVRVSASSSAPLRNGCGRTVASGAMRFCRLPSAATSSLTTKPPPTE